MSQFEDPKLEADVERLAKIIHDAGKLGIRHGDYTLARWILDRWPTVEPVTRTGDAKRS